MMRIFALSDLHGYFPPWIPECEVLLLAGDYCPTRNIEMEKRFMLEKFAPWLEKVKKDYGVKHIVGIGGNHDFILQEDRGLAEGLPWHYLQDSEIDIEGVRIYGTPWTKEFYNWAFMKHESKLKERFATIPEKLDILLSHGPAAKILDKNDAGEHCGSWALRERIMQAQPDSVVCGHIHEAHGIVQDGNTRYYNVSYLNARYEPKYNCVNIPLKV